MATQDDGWRSTCAPRHPPARGRPQIRRLPKKATGSVAGTEGCPLAPPCPPSLRCWAVWGHDKWAAPPAGIIHATKTQTRPARHWRTLAARELPTQGGASALGLTAQTRRGIGRLLRFRAAGGGDPKRPSSEQRPFARLWRRASRIPLRWRLAAEAQVQYCTVPSTVLPAVSVAPCGGIPVDFDPPRRPAHSVSLPASDGLGVRAVCRDRASCFIVSPRPQLLDLAPNSNSTDSTIALADLGDSRERATRKEVQTRGAPSGPLSSGPLHPQYRGGAGRSTSVPVDKSLLLQPRDPCSVQGGVSLASASICLTRTLPGPAHTTTSRRFPAAPPSAASARSFLASSPSSQPTSFPGSPWLILHSLPFATPLLRGLALIWGLCRMVSAAPTAPLDVVVRNRVSLRRQKTAAERPGGVPRSWPKLLGREVAPPLQVSSTWFCRPG